MLPSVIRLPLTAAVQPKQITPAERQRQKELFLHLSLLGMALAIAGLLAYNVAKIEEGW
jgi:hypothetical protein